MLRLEPDYTGGRKNTPCKLFFKNNRIFKPRNFAGIWESGRNFFDRFPNELSGGELQRCCVLRVLKPETKFIIADEISTMLDVITQSQIWDVTLDYAKRHNIGILAITHNIHLARVICDRITGTAHNRLKGPK